MTMKNKDKKRKKDGPQVWVRAEGKERAGLKQQRRMRESEKHIDNRAYVKKTKMSKLET